MISNGINPTSPHPDKAAAITHSLQLLLATGGVIIERFHNGQWQQATELLQWRDHYSRMHFSRYPVGPETRAIYRGQLATLFAQEQQLTSLKTSSPSPRKTALRLIKGN